MAKETVGSLGGMVRQLSLDQFENESRRMVTTHNDLSHPTKKFTRQKSPQGLHKKVRAAKFSYTSLLTKKLTYWAHCYNFACCPLFGCRSYQHCFGLGTGKLL